MDIGIPLEVRTHERRVALTPSGVKGLVEQGNRVWIETGAGAHAGHLDTEYQSAGATTVFARSEVFQRADLIVAVQAPEPRHYDLLGRGQIVFGFWGLPAAMPEDLHALQAREITAVGLEIIEDHSGCAPVLTSMSEIAGSLAVTLGSGLLLNEWGGQGILLGGAPGVPPANFVILGAGVLGSAAARTALGLGAHVTLLDCSIERLRRASHEFGKALATLSATRPNIEKALSFANLVLGAVAVRGERAPLLVPRTMLRSMRPRSVIMDLSIDMGGCFETSRPTSFPSPTYVVDDIVHFCVPNLPSVAARSSTLALTNAVLPYLLAVTRSGLDSAVATLPDLGRGVYLYRGKCSKQSLARAFQVPWDGVPVPGLEG